MLKRLRMTVARGLIPICVAPISAEALPAFLVKGASDSVEALGKVKPRQQRKRKIQAMVGNSPSHPFIVPNSNAAPITSCHTSAVTIIC